MSDEPNPVSDPAMTSRLTVRLEMFEVYEKSGSLLMVTSAHSEAKQAANTPGDQIVKCWWVRERPGP